MALRVALSKDSLERRVSTALVDSKWMHVSMFLIVSLFTMVKTGCRTGSEPSDSPCAQCTLA